MKQAEYYPPLDLKETMPASQTLGLWQLMHGFRWLYLTAIICLAIATTGRTVTYLLLEFFVDDVLIQRVDVPFFLIALAFVGLALVQGCFTFLSGRLAARSSEGIILRLRNYLFDHIQRLN